MNFLLGLCSVLSVIAIGNGWSVINRSGFSLVALPFKYHNIAPEFVDQAPKRLLQVEFPTFEANLGTKVLATEVTQQPEIIWNCDRNGYYTLVMFDCDPLGQNTRLLSELRHWVVGNIRRCDVDKGETIVDYLPASPIIGTGYHRFVFLMFQQVGRINFEEDFIRKTQMEGRPYTSLKKFALKYDLGPPIAGNFFLCEHDARSDETLDTIEYFPEYVERAIAQASYDRSQKRYIKQ